MSSHARRRGGSTVPRTVIGRPYDCRVPMTGIGAKHQCGDGDLPPADDGRITPGRNGTVLCRYLQATVNFQVRHEAGARSAVEEFALLFEKAQGVPKVLRTAPTRVQECYRLARRRKAELYAVHKDRANASPK